MPLTQDVRDQTLFDWVPLDDRIFAAPYSRPVRRWQVDRLRRNWSLKKVGTVYLSLRADGRFAILDGGHRIAAARLEGEKAVPARVYIDLTYEEEAGLYNDFATQNRQSALDRFRARVEAQERAALEIRDCLRLRGLQIRTGHAYGYVNAVYALDHVYTDHGLVILDASIDLLHKLWGGDQRAYAAWAIEGTAAFWVRYGRIVDRDRLCHRLQTVGLEVMIHESANMRTVVQHSRYHWGRAMVNIYNQGLRSRSRLEEWSLYANDGRFKAGNRAHNAPPEATAPPVS
jgi:Family of unknown function (DUF6551)